MHTYFYLFGLVLLAIASMVKKGGRLYKFSQVYLLLLLAVSAVGI